MSKDDQDLGRFEEELEAAAERLLEGAEEGASAVAEAATGAFLDSRNAPPMVVPEIASSRRFETALNNSATFLEAMLQEQAAGALRALSEVGVEIETLGAEILTEMSDYGAKLAAGEIGQATADFAIEASLESLSMLPEIGENEAKTEAFKRGMILLESTKSIAFSLIAAGVNAAVPGAGQLAAGLASVALDRATA